MVDQFKDNIAIVTGGSEGIGFGIASALAREGALVYLIARKKENLEKAKIKIEEQGGRAEIRPADITDFPSIRKVIDDIYNQNNRLDIFVNNAGAYTNATTQSSFEEIEKTLKLDFTAPLQITHYLIQKFGEIPSNQLGILTILSQQALVANLENGIGYGTAKKALRGALFEYENQLKHEGNSNITLYRIYPNTVATEKLLPLIKSGALKNPTSLESVVDTALDMLANKTPTRDVRVGYFPEKGILRIYLPSDPDNFYSGHPIQEKVIDKNFDPSSLI